jgi:hypothetical protein
VTGIERQDQKQTTPSQSRARRGWYAAQPGREGDLELNVKTRLEGGLLTRPYKGASISRSVAELTQEVAKALIDERPFVIYSRAPAGVT